MIRQLLDRLPGPRIRIVLDDGTPRCLPAWARDELVRRRLAMFDLEVRIDELEAALQAAQKDTP